MPRKHDLQCWAGLAWAKKQRIFFYYQLEIGRLDKSKKIQFQIKYFFKIGFISLFCF